MFHSVENSTNTSDSTKKKDVLTTGGTCSDKEDGTTELTQVPQTNSSKLQTTPTPPISQQSFLSATSSSTGKLDSPPVLSRRRRRRHERKERRPFQSQSGVGSVKENQQDHTLNDDHENKSSAVPHTREQLPNMPNTPVVTSQQSLNSIPSSSKFNSPPILKQSHKKQKQHLLDREEQRTHHGEEESQNSNYVNNEEHISAESQETSIASILNVVVDYYMSDPTPLEPEEFQWKLMMRQQRLKKGLNFPKSEQLDIENEVIQ